MDIVGVTNQSFERYADSLEVQIFRIDDAASRIMKRDFRKQVEELNGVLKDILLNCRSDQNDIREDLSLPSIATRIADSLSHWVTHSSDLHETAEISASLQEIENMAERATPYLKDLLRRMRANDALPEVVKARVIGRIFDFHQSQKTADQGDTDFKTNQ